MNRRHHVILEALQVRENPTGTGRGILDLCAALAEKERNLDFTVLTTSGCLLTKACNESASLISMNALSCSILRSE